MRGPPRPRASRDVHLVEDQSFGRDRRRQDVVDVAIGRSSAPEFLLHLARLDQPRRILADRLGRSDRELESAVGCDDLDGVAGRDVDDVRHLLEDRGAADLERLAASTNRACAAQRHDRRLLVISLIGMRASGFELDDLEAQEVPPGVLRGDVDPHGPVGVANTMMAHVGLTHRPDGASVAQWLARVRERFGKRFGHEISLSTSAICTGRFSCIERSAAVPMTSGARPSAPVAGLGPPSRT